MIIFESMNTDEAINQVIAKSKFYIGIMPQSSAANFLRRYKNGTAKQKTIIKFLARFGYVVDAELKFKKVKL